MNASTYAGENSELEGLTNMQALYKIIESQPELLNDKEKLFNVLSREGVIQDMSSFETKAFKQNGKDWGSYYDMIRATDEELKEASDQADFLRQIGIGLNNNNAYVSPHKVQEFKNFILRNKDSVEGYVNEGKSYFDAMRLTIDN